MYLYFLNSIALRKDYKWIHIWIEVYPIRIRLVYWPSGEVNISFRRERRKKRIRQERERDLELYYLHIQKKKKKKKKRHRAIMFKYIRISIYKVMKKKTI